jgi:PIN domain nuclease of toxin-antitoxin system
MRSEPVLLDTCALLWLVADQEQLSETARRKIAGSPASPFVSAISAFEIGVKSRRGALVLPLPAAEWYEAAIKGHGLNEIAVDGRAAIRSTLLPPIHRDPADRIIVATAMERGLTILTPDPLIRAYPGVEVVW